MNDKPQKSPAKEGLLEGLRMGYTHAATTLYKQCGPEIAPTPQEYEEATRIHFIERLTSTRTNVHEIMALREEMGMDLMGIPLPESFKDPIAEEFLKRLEKGSLYEATALRVAFKEVDFAKYKRYAEVMSGWFKRKYTGLYYFLTSLVNHPPAVTTFNNGKKPSPESLMEFESMIIFVTEYFYWKIQAELKGDGSLGFSEGDIDELSEQNQARLQAFAANLHTELSAKIRAIASPELIRAYLEQNGGGTGSEFLTQAA